MKWKQAILAGVSIEGNVSAEAAVDVLHQWGHDKFSLKWVVLEPCGAQAEADAARIELNSLAKWQKGIALELISNENRLSISMSS